MITKVCSYGQFVGIVTSEGNSLATSKPQVKQTVDQCKKTCDEKIDQGCTSFKHCPSPLVYPACDYRDNDPELTGLEESTKGGEGCFTAFRQCQDGIHFDIDFLTLTTI